MQAAEKLMLVDPQFLEQLKVDTNLPIQWLQQT